MARIEDTGKVEIGVSFPYPLDKPMERAENDGYGLNDLRFIIDELIQRQNALVEIVKAMILK